MRRHLNHNFFLIPSCLVHPHTVNLSTRIGENCRLAGYSSSTPSKLLYATDYFAIPLITPIDTMLGLFTTSFCLSAPWHRTEDLCHRHRQVLREHTRDSAPLVVDAPARAPPSSARPSARPSSERRRVWWVRWWPQSRVWARSPAAVPVCRLATRRLRVWWRLARTAVGGPATATGIPAWIRPTGIWWWISAGTATRQRCVRA